MTLRAHPDAFPLTRHSVVRAIRAPDPEARAAAYDAIIRGYWRPVYAYIRLRWHRDAEDARDLTQDFFTRAFEKEYLSRYDPAKARFRTFVRACLDGFLSNERQQAARLKRGGGCRIESLDFARAERELPVAASSADADPDACFRREWIRGLFAAAVDELRSRCDATGRTLALAVFTRYDLEESDSARPTYAALAEEFGTSSTTITNQLAWVRREFREIVLDSLRALCATDEEFTSEARALLGVTPR
ncbi:MAG TPA: sigma-70 family RNA polymerase sigma factor [Vicinamibacterales bacterium]|jgi:RNA polymerase sigma factor (sigma-70 family)|nr:sigma-70 family RNA polymerase sigma factor [Vicinamibacterales bacterium]